MARVVSVLVMAVSLIACARRSDEGAASHLAGASSESVQAGASEADGDTIKVCVLQGREARLSIANYDTVTGDTMIEGDASGRIYPLIPPPYADGAEWFARKEPIVFDGRAYVANGPRVVLFPGERKRVGEFRGITLFAEMEDTPGDFGILYVPTLPGCQLQPYYYFDDRGPIRG